MTHFRSALIDGVLSSLLCGPYYKYGTIRGTKLFLRKLFSHNKQQNPLSIPEKIQKKSQQKQYA